jgi:hypothetical protein
VPGFFIELMTLAEPDKLRSDEFSRLFGAHSRDFVSRGEGLSLMILETNDARADEAAFRAAGIAASDLLRFDREGKRPDGTAVKVGFSLAFAADEAAPDIHFASCQQHYPENFWNPAFQHHANGVQAILGIVVVADDPVAHRDFLKTFAGGQMKDADGMLAIETARGTIKVLTPSAYTRRFAVPAPDMARGARLAALRFSVRNFGTTASVLEKSVVPDNMGNSSLVVGPHNALGVTFVFEHP